MELVYATSNDAKFQIALSALAGTGVQLTRSGIDLPEIQSLDVEEIAVFSSIWASRELDCPVIVTDVGFYIEGLRGFPGPFVKYTNHWFAAEDIVKLMGAAVNRNACVKECLALCQPNHPPLVFHKEIKGVIVHELAESLDGGSVMDRLFKPEHYSTVLADLCKTDEVPFWSRHSAFHLLKDYLHAHGCLASR